MRARQAKGGVGAIGRHGSIIVGLAIGFPKIRSGIADDGIRREWLQKKVEVAVCGELVRLLVVAVRQIRIGRPAPRQGGPQWAQWALPADTVGSQWPSSGSRRANQRLTGVGERCTGH